MSEKKYTVAEANALLPYLAPTLVELREKFEAAEKIRELVAQAAATNGGSPHRDKWSRTMERVSELLERLEEWGVALRDVATGLVDFPGVVDGKDAWLCWRLGESEIGYWHGDDGFAGRRPL
jgi:hypothetical protein